MSDTKTPQTDGPDDLIEVMAEAVGHCTVVKPSRMRVSYTPPTDDEYAMGAHEISAVAQAGHREVSDLP